MRVRSIGLIALIVMLLLLSVGCSGEETERIEAYNIITCKVLKTSAENWNASSGDSIVCGMYGDGIIIESLGLELKNSIEPGSLEFQGHIQSFGWTDWIVSGGVAGEAGSGKRVEAVKIRLTGELAEAYDIYYRVYVNTMGWTAWACNGDMAGTEGLYKGIESIEVKLISKEGIPPKDGAIFDAVEENIVVPVLDYSIFLKGTGWLSYDGTDAGNPGGGGRAEGFKISVVDSVYEGSINYRTYAQTYGWLDWVSNGAFSGTESVSKRAEGIQITLTGELADNLDIYYRVCVENYGWLGWAANGQPAGTKDLALQIEAIEIVLKAKGDTPPGETVMASISPVIDVKADVDTILNKTRERMTAVGKYYVEDTSAFKNRNGAYDESTQDIAEEISKAEIKSYCESQLYSGLVEVNVSFVDGDINDYCAQEILKYYIGKGDKVTFYTEFVGYTMDNSLVFRCYYSRS